MGYVVHELVGKGSFGHVHRATDRETGKTYAIKRLELARLNHYERVCLLNELRMLATHTCPFLVAFKEAYVEDNRFLHIVTEFAAHGDLASLLRRRQRQQRRLSENEVWHLLLQICVAVDYLHRVGVLHRDLKPANVLLDAQDNVRLADLGLVKILRGAADVQSQVGTPLYMPPEIYKRERYDAKADVWSLGCVLCELMTLRAAFGGANIVALRDNIFRGRVQDGGTGYSAELRGLLSSLLRVSPRQRPSLAQVLAAPPVRAQMSARGLDRVGEVHADVKPLFHVACVPPKRVDEWKNVVELFCEVGTTAHLDATAEKRLRAVHDLRLQLERRPVPLRAPARYVVPTEAVHDVERQLEAARREVRRLERRLAELQR